jgi:ABC-2 type transport system ATP-binding protein
VRILSTLIEPDAGHARIAGFDVVKEPIAVRRCIGLAGQYAAVDETLTGRENLEMVGRLSRLSKRDAARRAQEVLERVHLVDAADRQLKTYSGGMRRRVDLGAGLVARPQVLLLDEPTTGLDPANRLDLWDYLRVLVGEGSTVLLTTQYLEEADQLAGDIVVIDHGLVIAQGTPTELKARLAADVLDITVQSSDLDRVATVLAGIGTDTPQVEGGSRKVSVPVANGANDLVEAVRRLDDEGIVVVDITLRRPSLDDVFLALTGHAAHDATPAAEEEDR